MNKISYKKAGFLTIIAICMISTILITINIPSNVKDTDSTKVLPDFIDDGDEGEWQLLQIINSKGKILYPLGENLTGVGWRENFFLNYTETAETFLQYNGTYEGNVSIFGYVDTDNAETDLESERYGFYCVRCAFDDTAKDEGSWIWDRYKVKLNFSNDELIFDIEEMDNSTNGGTAGTGFAHYGDAVVSSTGSDWIYINFWWDDNDDGYRITDDGTIDWNIEIYQKY